MKTERLYKIPGLFMLILISVILGCTKDPEPQKDSELISFTGLVTEDDSLYIGELTVIKAIYEGRKITFEWEASVGDILGGGDSVQYLASFCATGQNTITCKASSEDTSITRSIFIYVE